MNMALIADIHSNLSALDAVPNDIPSEIDTLVCAVDIVDYSA